MSYDEAEHERAMSGTDTGACPNCGQAVGAPTKFCGLCGWPIGVGGQGSSQVSCSICWSANPASNRFCENCAARLGLRPGYTPARSGVRSTPFSGGVLTLSFVLGLLFLVVLLVIALGEDEDPSPTTVSPTVPATTSTSESAAPFSGDPAGPRSLTPSEVVASSELSTEFAATNLVDGDTDTVWRDASLNGDDALLTFRFDQSVTLDAVVIIGIPDDEAFHRSFRIRGFRLDPGGGAPPVDDEVPDSPAPHRIDLGGIETTGIVLEVLSTHAAESHGEAPAAEELAVAEVEIVGRRDNGSNEPAS